MKARILLFLILTGSLFYQQSFAQMSNSNEPASVSSDSSSGVQTTYNILNLPSQQTSSGQTIRHSYLADGTRWKSVNASGSGFTYRGSFEYDGAGTTLRSVGFSEGRIHATSSGTLTDVAYHIKDHLGSVRAIVNASGTVTERNDYHPYGARHSNSSLTKASGNRWRFSGKEEFDDAFGLPQSDFGARFYDRAAWSSLDPLAEKYYSLSPYAFCAGNPIIFVDRDGRAIGNYYSYSGDFVVNDGIDDNKLYIVSEQRANNYLNNKITLEELRIEAEEIGGLIVHNRFDETDKYTASTLFAIGGNISVSGYILEPAGPSTSLPNQNKRIPEGHYFLDNYSSKKYPSHYVIYNEYLNKSRAILYHIGNTYKDTLGCMLPGTTYKDGFVGDSTNKYNELKYFIYKIGPENIRIIINNSIAPNED